jgi:hypothetical protein
MSILDYLRNKDEFDNINVKKEPDLSSPIGNAEDFIKSNSDVLNIYSKGKDFDLTDNQNLYEVVKLMKDILDKHLFVRDIVYKFDIKNRKLTVNIELREGYEDGNYYFLDGFYQYIVSQINLKFGSNFFKIRKYMKKNYDGFDVMIIDINEAMEEHKC